MAVFLLLLSSGCICVYGLFVGMVIYREVKLKDLFDICVDSAKTTGGIMLIVASASLFSYVCTKFGIADAASALLGSIAHNQFTFLLIVKHYFLIAAASSMQTLLCTFLFRLCFRYAKHLVMMWLHLV